jgi:hypothetical protein
MDKQFIISEIQRTAENGRALGQIRFSSETGIKRHECIGKYWARWSDALAEAGFAQNEWNAAHDEAYVVTSVLGLARKLGRFPTKYDIQFARSSDSAMPSYDAVARLGTRFEVKKKFLQFCSNNASYNDVLNLVLAIPAKENEIATLAEDRRIVGGYVYLVSAQNAYKIGSTRAPYRRVSEIANQSAKGAELLHLISTDDPEGIEQYWHKRFITKRITGINKQSGEWFSLSSEEVKVFKRRKTM